MSKVGKLYMLPKVEEQYDEVQQVEPIRIMEDEFCDTKEEDADTPYIADFELCENKIYMMTMNKRRNKYRVYRIAVQSSSEYVVEQRTDFSHKLDFNGSWARLKLIDGYLFFMKHSQNLIKCKCSDFEANTEVIVDDDNRESGKHELHLMHDIGLNLLVVRMREVFYYINPATLSIVSKTKCHSM